MAGRTVTTKYGPRTNVRIKIVYHTDFKRVILPRLMIFTAKRAYNAASFLRTQIYNLYNTRWGSLPTKFGPLIRRARWFSAPGAAPYMQTQNLRNSVNSDKRAIEAEMAPDFSKYHLRLFTDVEYAHSVERGGPSRTNVTRRYTVIRLINRKWKRKMIAARPVWIKAWMGYVNHVVRMITG